MKKLILLSIVFVVGCKDDKYDSMKKENARLKAGNILIEQAIISATKAESFIIDKVYNRNDSFAYYTGMHDAFKIAADSAYKNDPQ